MWGVLGTSPQATAVRMPTVPLMCLPPTNMGNPSSRWHPGDRQGSATEAPGSAFVPTPQPYSRDNELLPFLNPHFRLLAR